MSIRISKNLLICGFFPVEPSNNSFLLGYENRDSYNLNFWGFISSIKLLDLPWSDYHTHLKPHVGTGLEYTYDPSCIYIYIHIIYIVTGWWFGTWILWFSIELGMSWSQLTLTYLHFFRKTIGGSTTNQILSLTIINHIITININH